MIALQCVHKAHTTTADGRPARSEPHLVLIGFLPAPNARPVVCAAMCQCGRDVRLLAPVLRRPGAGPDALTCPLSWHEAACFAAADAEQARQACDAKPDWHLQYQSFDDSDGALQALADLIRACRRTVERR